MKLETDRDVTEWIHAAKALAVVSAWSGLGLFDKLRAGPLPIRELGMEARALATTIPVLRHVGLVATSADRIGLTATGERLLAQGSMPTARNLDVLGDLSRMAEVVRTGGPVKDEQGNSRATKGGTSVGNPEATERFMDMLYRMSEEPARATLTWLGPTLPAGAAVLDLGGGHGRYARAFADAGHTVTLFDQPMITAMARKRHGDALHYLDGDFHEVDSLGGPYDLVLLANIVHSESSDQNRALIARATQSLKPGGRVAVRDMFLDELGGDPASAVFFGITMLYYTNLGASPTMQDIRAWYEHAGLVDVAVIGHETHQIVVGRKPA